MNARVIIDSQFQAQAARLRPTAPIVPTGTAASRALIVMIAIMTFVAALTIGAVHLVNGAADQWRSGLGREVTVEVRPAESRNIEADVRKVVEIADRAPGVASARAYSKEEMARLVAPWLGTLDPANLPLPRLIAVRLDGDEADITALRAALAREVPSASLDDSSRWMELSASADRVTIGGSALLVLVLVATVLSVAFATRGAVAANRAIVELLHVVGARNAFVAGEFQRHFMTLGASGSLVGAAAATALFALAGLAFGLFSPGGDGTAGALMLDADGYGGIAGVALIVIAVTAVISRLTVHRTLKAID
jgi:cell division transport system permease protein